MILWLALLPALAAAEETGWDSFRSQCVAELKPAWVAQMNSGRQWEVDSMENLRQLEEMTRKICPTYFKRPNDTAAIKSFDNSKTAILDRSPIVERKGNALLEFLGQGLADNQALFSSVKIDFSSTPCGLHMQSTQQRMANRLKEIQNKVSTLAKTCFGVTAEEAARALAAKEPPKPTGIGAPARMPASQKQKPGSKGSDITGIKEDAEKRLK